METGIWKKVVNKNQKRKTKYKEIEAERIKWNKLEKEIPHIVLPNRANRLQIKLNIDNLENKLLSDEFIEHQRCGWKYVKVLKSTVMFEEKSNIDTTTDGHIIYSVLSLDNGWGDKILFSKTKKKSLTEQNA